MFGKAIVILGSMFAAPYLAGFINHDLQMVIVGIDVGVILTIIGGAVYLLRAMSKGVQQKSKDLAKAMEEAGIHLGKEEED